MRLALSGLLALALALAQKPAPVKKSAKDKATLEAYVRHLFIWGPQVNITITDPKPAPMKGFAEMKVIASSGPARQEEIFYVSDDGQKILRGLVFDVAQNPFKSDLEKLHTQFQPSFGTPGATVVIVMFSDFQCTFCREEAKMIRQNLLSAYPKQVRVYFKDFPLEQIHPWAKPAAIAGRCVFRQDAAKYWDYHDWIFDKQADITPENLKAKVLEWAGQQKLDTVTLTRCIDSKSTEADVDKNIAEAKALNVNSTPTVYVNGRKLVGQIAWPQLRQIIDYEIDYQKTAKNAGEDCGCELKIPSPLSN
jgi:protein-disulfide isomerase